MLVLMSTQLCSGPSPEPKDVHPFIDAAMLQVQLELPMYSDLFPNILEINLNCVSMLHNSSIPLQDSTIVVSVVQNLLLNFVTRPKFPADGQHPVFSDDDRPSVLQRVSSAAGKTETFFVL
jgi:dymeclin